MTACVYEFEIPDLSRPIANATELSPSGELQPFIPVPLNAGGVAGREITDILSHAGTYGMGGPGFLALGLDREWLVIALWGAAAWTTCQGRLVEDFFHGGTGRPEPWMTEADGIAPLKERLAGQRILAINIQPISLHIAINSSFDLTIAADPATRPVYQGDGKPRAFAPDDDLRRAVFLSPTTELWV